MTKITVVFRNSANMSNKRRSK